jgi:hypothetical protein
MTGSGRMTGKPEIMPDCGINFRLTDKPEITGKTDTSVRVSTCFTRQEPTTCNESLK